MIPYIDDADFTLYVGDATEVLRELPDESVHCVVTSPPYWGLRDYGTGTWQGGSNDCDHVAGRGGHLADSTATTRGGAHQVAEAQTVPFKGDCGKCGARRVDQQIGLEPTPDAYVARMVDVFRQVRRVLRSDGSLWLNIGDSYAQTTVRHRRDVSDTDWAKNYGHVDNGRSTAVDGLKPKDLVGIPWLLAFALRADGWWLRSEITWCKKNCMPESVVDRPTNATEKVFLFTKSARYFYDSDAVREPHTHDGRQETRVVGREGSIQHRNGERWPGAGRNMRNFWLLATEPYPDAHFATFPSELARRCILAGTSENGVCGECGAPRERQVEVTGGTIGTGWHGHNNDLGRGQRGGDDGNAAAAGWKSYKRESTGWQPTCACDAPITAAVVLDPFMGSGTVAHVARQHGRHAIGIELNEQYAELAAKRTSQQSLLAEPTRLEAMSPTSEEH